MLKKGQTGKLMKDQPKLEFAKVTPPICHGSRDAQYNSQQGRKIPTHGRKDKVINLQFIHDSKKLLDSGA